MTEAMPATIEPPSQIGAPPPGPTGTAAWRARLVPFVKFGMVGTLGLGWDTASVYGLRPLIGLTGATIAAYFIAATLNWLLNRHWTFRHVAHADPVLVQWARFLLANALGFVLNRGMVFTLFMTVPICRTIPALALAAGSLAGLFANFNLSRRVVFRHRPDAPAPDALVPEVLAPDAPAGQGQPG